jgi:hypothetical protein
MVGSTVARACCIGRHQRPVSCRARTCRRSHSQSRAAGRADFSAVGAGFDPPRAPGALGTARRENDARLAYLDRSRGCRIERAGTRVRSFTCDWEQRVHSNPLCPRLSVRSTRQGLAREGWTDSTHRRPSGACSCRNPRLVAAARSGDQTYGAGRGMLSRLLAAGAIEARVLPA